MCLTDFPPEYPSEPCRFLNLKLDDLEALCSQYAERSEPVLFSAYQLLVDHFSSESTIPAVEIAEESKSKLFVSVTWLDHMRRPVPYIAWLMQHATTDDSIVSFRLISQRIPLSSRALCVVGTPDSCFDPEDGFIKALYLVIESTQPNSGAHLQQRFRNECVDVNSRGAPCLERQSKLLIDTAWSDLLTGRASVVAPHPTTPIWSSYAIVHSWESALQDASDSTCVTALMKALDIRRS